MMSFAGVSQKLFSRKTFRVRETQKHAGFPQISTRKQYFSQKNKKRENEKLHNFYGEKNK